MLTIERARWRRRMVGVLLSYRADGGAGQGVGQRLY